MTPTDRCARRPIARLALAAALVAALGLGACGRKGPLDPPPGAPALAPAPQNGPGAAAAPTHDAQGNPIVRGEKKPFVLDWLLN